MLFRVFLLFSMLSFSTIPLFQGRTESPALPSDGLQLEADACCGPSPPPCPECR